MIYGIERSTDMRDSNRKIVKFRSEKKAREWLQKPKELAYPGAARDDIPGPSQNFHHLIRTCFVMPPGFNLNHYQGEIGRELRDWRRNGSRTYPKSEDSIKHNIIHRERECEFL